MAPYFVEYVRQQLRTRFGSELYRDGLRIYTTVDLDIQQAAERAIFRQLDEIERNKTTFGKYPRATYADYLEKRTDDTEPPAQSPYLQGLLSEDSDQFADSQLGCLKEAEDAQPGLLASRLEASKQRRKGERREVFAR